MPRNTTVLTNNIVNTGAVAGDFGLLVNLKDVTLQAIEIDLAGDSIEKNVLCFIKAKLFKNLYLTRGALPTSDKGIDIISGTFDGTDVSWIGILDLHGYWTLDVRYYNVPSNSLIDLHVLAEEL